MKVHVLEGNLTGTYRIVVHGPVPGGNNSAGHSWSSVLIAAGRNKTILPIGTNGTPGVILQAEADQIAQGTVIEFVTDFTDNPALTTPAQRAADLDLQATNALAQGTAQLSESLRWYGATRN